MSIMSSDLAFQPPPFPLISNHEVWRGSVWYTGSRGEIERHGESESIQGSTIVISLRPQTSDLGSRADEDVFYFCSLSL
jgi:hypothetical protein